MNTISHFLSLLFLCCLTSTLGLAQTNIDLFIVAGQSNAQGYKGDAAQYPTNTAVDATINLYYTDHGSTSSGGQWINMQPQSGLFNAGHFGPEVTFSRNLKTAGYNPAIFKYVAPGTGLAADWKAPRGGGIYDAMVVAYKAAIKKLTDAGNTVTVRGFVWIQGESDGYSTAAVADAYQANLTTLINDVRLNMVGNSCLPFVLGVDEQFPGNYINTVVQAQKNIAANTPKVAFTSMIGLQKSDVTHLTPTGLIAHGTRVYDGYVTIVPNSAAFTNCSASSTPTISANKPSGIYTAPFSVALTGTSGATIRYTTDGTTPTATIGTVYTAPITIGATTTVKAIAIVNATVSSVLTLNYVFGVSACTSTTNLALNKTTSQSSIAFSGPSSRAVDGNTSGVWGNNSITHTNNDANSWWQVDLGQVNNIDVIKLFNRTDVATDRLANFYVFVSETPFTSTDLTTTLGQTTTVKSYYVAGIAGAQTDIPFFTTGRYVRVQLKTQNYLSLAEVQVMGCAVTVPTVGICTATSNLAVNKTTNQSSIAFSGPSSRAVDGNTSGAWGNNSVTHTNNDANSWWQVDLGTINNIAVVKLFNRTDCCGERLSNFYVLVSETAFSSTDLTTTLAQTTVKSYYFSGTATPQTDFTINAKGRYVRVQLKTQNYLSLAEVQVMGCAVPIAALAGNNAIFTAQGRQEGTKAVISWVSNADNADYFVVERLNSDNNAFEKLETVNTQSKNSSKEAHYYTSTDNAPTKGINVYRVGVILQGSSTPQYSGQIALDFSQFVNYVVSPNPALDYIDIHLNEKQIDEVQVRVMDLMGKTVMQEKISKATDALHLSVEGLEAGQYLIFVEAKGKRATAKKLTITK